MIRFTQSTIGPRERPVLENFSWELKTGQSWFISGPNGSGKSAIGKALAGTIETTGLEIDAELKIGLLSFERQHEILEWERAHDDSDFVEGGVDKGTTVGKFLGQNSEAVCEKVGISYLRDRGLKYLSTGEFRAFLLCRALLANDDLLILDEAFEGLDTARRSILVDSVRTIIDNKSATILVIGEHENELSALCSDTLRLKKRNADPTESADPGETVPADLVSLNDISLPAPASGHEPSDNADSEILVEMRAVNVSWDGQPILENLDWQLRAGTHTLIRGPNGCGKTSLLRLITGDNPQVYSNDVRIFGIQRGTGESIWEIKKNIGYVSHQLHLDYLHQSRASLGETIVSGFRDSIGMYEAPEFRERAAARRWLDVLGLREKSGDAFSSLSWGEQRAALVARAAIKSPRILILDEPCHGLDPIQRRRILDIADFIGTHGLSTILHVTHDPEEVLSCTREILEFVPRQPQEAMGEGHDPAGPRGRSGMSGGAGGAQPRYVVVRRPPDFR